MPCVFSISIVHEGKQAIDCHAQAHQKGGAKNNGGTVRIFPASGVPVDLSSAKNIFAWVYDVQGGNTVQLVIWDSAGNRSNEVWSARPTTKEGWTKITWVLSSFKGIDLHQVNYIEIYMFNDGEYYFDDISYQ